MGTSFYIRVNLAGTLLAVLISGVFLLISAGVIRLGPEAGPTPVSQAPPTSTSAVALDTATQPPVIEPTTGVVQPTVVRLDFSQIYVLDSYGQRYGDWAGGELMERTVDACASWELERYYSLQRRSRSRVPSSAEYVLFKVEQLGSITGKLRRYDIQR